ncbi:hypothetical protein AXG93_2145s1550 [Marchantia polymorpha subsp. ruderalis]|uniref:Reverse transcriptase domain-containing protein n=1 Tax=Marchantia polymorpha subsp. ruderalis TaxID=1480154 RepID=A0A176W0X6_MARPO|nr:hypothetical protein AXG93_2145s1550 [Marchantia polymorpha subsp. ruderalis]
MMAIGHLLSRDLQTVCAPGQKGVRGEGTWGTALLIHKSLKIRESGTSEDGYITWAQVEKGGHEVYIASVYGPHSPGGRAAHWTHLRNLFPHTNVILCGDWNMVDNASNSLGERQVLGGGEEMAFTEVRTKHNLQDVREIAAEVRGPLHTRWYAYGGDPRWARLDRIYFSHAGRWLAAAHYLQQHAGITLSDHLPVTTSVDMGTVVCVDGRLSLAGPTTFKWSPSLLGKPQIQAGIKRIWKKLERRSDDPRKVYHKGTTQVRNFLRVKQKEQRARLSHIQELQLEIADLHSSPPGKLTKQQNSARAQILQLHLPTGEGTRDQAKIMCAVGQYYAELYTAQTQSTEDAVTREELLHSVEDNLTDAERSMLAAPPLEKEIEDVLFSLPHNKAPEDAARTYKRQGMFVKLDFEKTYDRVEHNYLWDAMLKCGLGPGFITLVKGLTLGASTAVQVNGAKTYRFPVGRGVRQGCPLAPLLFVLATQPLMSEMKISFQAGRIRDYQAPRLVPPHKLHADAARGGAQISWGASRPKARGGLGIRCLADTNSSLMGKWIGFIIDESAGTWGLALAELEDTSWDPAGVAIPRNITLRDIVSLTVKHWEENGLHTKQILAELRSLKITQMETPWRKKEELKRTFVRGRANEQRRAEGSLMHVFMHKITSAMRLTSAPLRTSAGWKIRGKPIAGNFTEAARSRYMDKTQATSLGERLNRKWHSQKSEAEWEKIFADLWKSRNVNRDKLFMWRVLQQALYTNERAAKIGHGDGRCPRGCPTTESVFHILFDCPVAQQVWRAAANLRWRLPRHEQPIFGNATSLLQLIELGLAQRRNSSIAAQWMLTTEICRHLWLSRNQKLFSDIISTVNLHSRTRNTIDKAISLWKESSADPPQRYWLE